jgi:4,5-dihydroxyphthalate decarboxylase
MRRTIKLFFREPTIDTNAPITTRAVGVDGFDVEFARSIEEADAWDSSFAKLLVNHARRNDCVSIPAFPNRKFRLSYIFVNADAGVRTPRDLEGRRVGVRFWNNTAGVWARGALRHHYGVDLSKIRWTIGRRDETTFPAGALDVAYLSDAGGAPPGGLDALLLAGELDAVIDANVLPSITRRDPRVRRLFKDYVDEEQAYFRATGIFPISHVVTLRRPFVERHPDAPAALLAAFRRARDLAVEAVDGPDPQVIVVSWMSHFLARQRELMGEHYFAYDVARNRAPLAAMTRYAHEQWLTPREIAVDELFHPSVLESADG